MERRLSAIFAADMVGYSRLMEADEVGTLQRQKSHRREFINPAFEEFHGRIVKEIGDGILVEFPSVVEAVQCAVAIQRAMVDREASISDDLRIQYRIGINLGDIIIEDDDIFGDGVNIAARLEQMALPDGICISGTAYDHLISKIDVGYESLGEVKVKNIERTIRAYRVLINSDHAGEVIGRKRSGKTNIIRFAAITTLILVALIGVSAWWLFQQSEFEPVDPANMALKLPDKPSIAVLPFANLSDDPDQVYFSDGLTEDIITKLSSFPNLFVIGSNSTGKYQGKETDIRAVAKDMGVRYVLRGSVRRSGKSLRISAQLIDALNGASLWAQKYDHELDDVFRLQDEITKQVTTRLASNIVEAEFRERTRGGTRNLKAYDYFLRGWRAMLVVNPKSNAHAIGMFEKAIEADPQYARAYAGLGMARANNTSFKWAQGPKDNYENAISLVKKAVEYGPNDQLSHRILGSVLRYQGYFDQAIEAYKQALARSPSNPDVLIALAFTNALAGRGTQAVQDAKTALRLNPFPPPHYFSWQGISYYVDKQFEEALIAFELFKKSNPKFFLGYFWTALGHAQLGGINSAKLQIEKLLKLRPNFTIQAVLAQNKAKGSAKDLIQEGARKAGIPEHPPKKLPDKPSIAVLPFDNMSNDPEQEYFSDGMTEDLITDLSQVSGLFVIARNSTFIYKGKSVNITQIGGELGVRYMVEGSIRKQGDRVRINAQLIDVQTGGHIWAQRYDRNLTDVFALQDEVVKKIVSALAVTLNPREQEQLANSSPVVPEAYDKLLRGLEKFRRFTAETNLEAREYFESAIAIDPTSPVPMLTWH